MHLIHFAYCNESALYAFAGSGLSKLSTAIMEYSHVRVDEPFGCLPSTSLIIQVNIKFCTLVNGRLHVFCSNPNIGDAVQWYRE